MGKAKALPDYPRGLTFEDVWAALMENREQLKETARYIAEIQKETDRQKKETDRRMEENDRIIKENAQAIKETFQAIEETDRQMKETDRQMKETDKRLDKQLGNLGNRFGEMVEYMVKPCLVEKFRELGFEFTRASRDLIIKDRKNNIVAEVDFVLEDGDKVMLVEIKTKLTTNDITEHIERMEKVRKHARLRNDNRIYLGAIGGMVINENEKKFTLKNGFYAIEPSGETFAITAPEGDYSPREW